MGAQFGMPSVGGVSMVTRDGGRSNILAVKAPVGGRSKSLVLIATDFPVAIVLAKQKFLRNKPGY